MHTENGGSAERITVSRGRGGGVESKTFRNEKIHSEKYLELTYHGTKRLIPGLV